MTTTLNASTAGAGGFIATSDNSGVLALQTAGTTAITVDASQNVGIGTTSPTQKLQVQGFIKTGSGGATGGGLEFPYSSDTASRSWRTKNDEASFGDYAITQSTTQTGSTYVIQARISETGVFQFNSGYGSAANVYGCRAWVNFNGTGTVAIRASGNVSSITDNAVGDYTVNFTTAMPDANYAVTHAYSREADCFAGNIATNNATGLNVTPTTSAIRVVTSGGSGLGGKDVSYINVTIVR